MIEAKQTHCGQYNRYGDFFRVWTIQTNLSKEEVVTWCFESLYHGCTLPCSGEYFSNIRYGAPKFSDADYYFRGYYTIEKIDGGYKFTICEPFTD